MLDLGTLAPWWDSTSEANGINDSGQVVGVTSVTNSDSLHPNHAFLYVNGMMQDLNTFISPVSGSLADARSINNLGQIAASGGVNAGGNQDALLLSPVQPPTPPTLAITMMPTITIMGGVGNTYQLQYANTLSTSNAWINLAVITVTNAPQFYCDLSSVGQSARFYRLVQRP